MTDIHHTDCTEWLSSNTLEIDLTFLDPPFNQGRDYREFDDNLPAPQYWEWVRTLLSEVFKQTSDGGVVYFMQREKNAEFVLAALRATGWNLQNLIIWKKLSSAVPGRFRFGKQYQIIAVAIKGERPKVFNKLKINPPLEAHQQLKRQTGVYLTDVWSDIRELSQDISQVKNLCETETGIDSTDSNLRLRF